MEDFVAKSAKASSQKTVGNIGASSSVGYRPSKNTKLVKKKGAQAADPTTMKVGKRKKVIAKATGAAYGIKAVIPAYKSAEAGPTQASGKLVSSPYNRQKPAFDQGNQRAYLD